MRAHNKAIYVDFNCLSLFIIIIHTNNLISLSPLFTPQLECMPCANLSPTIAHSFLFVILFFEMTQQTKKSIQLFIVWIVWDMLC